MSLRALGQQFTTGMREKAQTTIQKTVPATREHLYTAADMVSTYGRMLTVGHVNYRDMIHHSTPEERASEDRGYALLKGNR